MERLGDGGGGRCGEAGIRNDPDAGGGRLPGGILFAFGGAGGAEIQRGLGAVRDSESVAVPAAPEGCRYFLLALVFLLFIWIAV